MVRLGSRAGYVVWPNHSRMNPLKRKSAALPTDRVPLGQFPVLPAKRIQAGSYRSHSLIQATGITTTAPPFQHRRTGHPQTKSPGHPPSFTVGEAASPSEDGVGRAADFVEEAQKDAPVGLVFNGRVLWNDLTGSHASDLRPQARDTRYRLTIS